MSAIDPADTPSTLARHEHDVQVQLDARKEYIVAQRACKPHERRWIRCVLECEGNAYEAGRMAQIGKATVFRLLRLPRTARAFAAANLVLELEYGINAFQILREYARIAKSKLRDAYHPEGHAQQGQLKKPHEWDDDTAACISEYSFDKNGDPCIKMHAKGPALEALTKLRNLAPPARVEVTGKDGERLNQGAAVMVVPGMVTEAAWAAAAAAQQQHLSKAESTFVEPSRAP